MTAGIALLIGFAAGALLIGFIHTPGPLDPSHERVAQLLATIARLKKVIDSQARLLDQAYGLDEIDVEPLADFYNQEEAE